MSTDALVRLRTMCRTLPEVTELANVRPVFRVGHKSFAMYMDNHHNDGRVALWCKAGPGIQQALVGADPAHYFVPPYVGAQGWIGIRLDGVVDWDAVAGLLVEGYRLQAPKRLVALLDRS
ncbi:MAG: MmcQ/YjbR family DNA-binding protein [Herpetosiphonaceae bacterium]|nr:MmcQ/YjbR family DNA-binding protein [Herpetosiphonaceae bacterium]